MQARRLPDLVYFLLLRFQGMSGKMILTNSINSAKLPGPSVEGLNRGVIYAGRGPFVPVGAGQNDCGYQDSNGQDDGAEMLSDHWFRGRSEINA
jgi:hypothetical protein